MARQCSKDRSGQQSHGQRGARNRHPHPPIGCRHNAQCRVHHKGQDVSSFRLAARVALLGTTLLADAMVSAGQNRAGAQGKLDARYTVSLGGLPIGRGAWMIDIAEDHFTTAANGATTGLMRIFASGHGQSTARGVISGGQPIPSDYEASVVTDRKRYDHVRMVISSGIVKHHVADPPTVASADRVPVTEAHKRNVSDPMTASFIRVPGVGDIVVPQACARTLAIFDGRMRYDLRLAFKRLEMVKTEIGYQGPAVVCALQFTPIAGHVPERSAIKYLVQLNDMELWLAPIAGTRITVPYRISIPTPIGVGILQATQFISMPQPSRASVRPH
jgi:Protein of unknown function (DUF3108)